MTTTEIYTQVSIKKLKEIHTATHPARAQRERPGDRNGKGAPPRNGQTPSDKPPASP